MRRRITLSDPNLHRWPFQRQRVPSSGDFVWPRRNCRVSFFNLTESPTEGRPFEKKNLAPLRSDHSGVTHTHALHGPCTRNEHSQKESVCHDQSLAAQELISIAGSYGPGRVTLWQTLDISLEPQNTETQLMSAIPQLSADAGSPTAQSELAPSACTA